MEKPYKSIPVSAAEYMAKKYGYHQVVIIARHVSDDDGMEHVTTYGVDAANCAGAAWIGHYIKHKILKWPEQT